MTSTCSKSRPRFLHKCWVTHGLVPRRSINFPTVARGEERLRITPTPGHTVEQQTRLLSALESVWQELDLKRTTDWTLEGGRAGVGVAAGQEQGVNRVWTDKQLGLEDGSAPVRLGADVQDPARGSLEGIAFAESKVAANVVAATA